MFELTEQLREQQNVIVRLELQLVHWRSASAACHNSSESLAPLARSRTSASRFPICSHPDSIDDMPAIRFAESLLNPSPVGPRGQPDICGVKTPPPLSSIPLPFPTEAGLLVGNGCSVLRDVDSTIDSHSFCTIPSRAEAKTIKIALQTIS